MSETRSEEYLIPFVRAMLAQRLNREGFRARVIANALNVTQPAVTQYLKGRRGTRDSPAPAHAESIINPLADRLLKRMRSGLGGLETAELLEAAHQLASLSKGGERVGPPKTGESAKVKASLGVLRERLQLEFKVAERYLELANRTPDDYTKLLLRLIASDSIRHGDIVEQVISWFEVEREFGERFQAPGLELLKQMLSMEDTAAEVSLKKTVDTAHPVAKLLLEWIDADEEKHERIVKQIMRMASHKTSL
jgi:rubrerythrin